MTAPMSQRGQRIEERIGHIGELGSVCIGGGQRVSKIL